MNRCLKGFSLVSVVLTLSLSAFTESPDSQIEDTGQTQASGANLGSVRFSLYRDYLIVVKGSTEGLNELNLLVDTGADPSVVDQKLAAKLQLQPQAARIAVMNQTVAAGRTVLPHLKVGPVRIDDVPVLVEDLSFLEKGLQVRIDAVIGLDVLGRNSFSIDYKAREIHFGDRLPMPFSVPLQLGQRFVTVDVSLNGQPFRLLVDTGASSLMLFGTRIQGRLHELRVQELKSSVNLAGRFDRKRVLFQDVRMGTVGLGQQAGFVVDDQKDSGRDFDGLLSLRALGLTEVAFDFQHGTLGWSR
jgi:predicted aspartyl protease